MKTEKTKKKSRAAFAILLFFACVSISILPEASFAFTGGVDATPKIVKEVPKNQAKVCRDVTCSNPPPTIVDFNKKSDFPLVIDSVLGLSGKVWGGDLGWITFNPPFGGVRFADLSTGRLTGTAWSQTSGVINFDVTGQQVTIDPKTGEWRGWAWASGPYGGWIKFDCDDPDACVRSTWRGTGSYLNETPEGTAPFISGPVAPSQTTNPSSNFTTQTSTPSVVPTPAGGTETSGAAAKTGPTFPKKPENTVPSVPTAADQKNSVPVAISGFLDGLAESTGNLSQGAGKSLSGAADAASSGAQSFFGGFSLGWHYLWNDLGDYLKRCGESLKETVAIFSSAASRLADGISGGAGGMASAISALPAETARGIGSGAGSAASSVAGVFSGVAQSAADGFTGAVQGVSSGLSGAVSSVSSSFSNIADGASAGTSSVVSSVSGLASGLVNGVSNGVGSAFSSLSNLASGMTKGAESGISSGISSGAGAASAIRAFSASAGSTASRFAGDISYGEKQIGKLAIGFWDELLGGFSYYGKIVGDAVSRLSL